MDEAHIETLRWFEGIVHGIFDAGGCAGGVRVE